MFHIYNDKFRITSNPISYNFLISYYFKDKMFNYRMVSEMKLGEGYTFNEFKVVRVI